MSTAGRQIAEAVAAVDILSPTRYAWLGDPSPPLPRHVTRRLDRDQARSYLMYALQSCLYESFYCPGRAVVAPPPRRAGYRRGDPHFVAALSSANAGSGCWEPGWRLRARGARWVEAERDGLVLRAAPGEVRAGSGAGGDLALRFPNEMRGMAPGFYMALTDLPVERSARLLRVYWNLRPDGAATFVREATRRFNDARIGATLKVVHDPLHFDRCDAGVLYLAHTDLPAAARIARSLHEGLAGQLEASVPALTMRLSAGVALAEDPGDGRSFGQSRCELIAGGIVRAHEQGLRSLEQRVQAVREAMAAEGVDGDAPHLNAGSSDGYEALADAFAHSTA